MDKRQDLSGRKADLLNIDRNIPWLGTGMQAYGRHETRDNAWLRQWLKSDGKTLGDPDAQPWCGDFVDTAIALALPKEPRPGDLGENPYWALNWALLGVPVGEVYGAVAVFKRDGGGHVGFAIGQDRSHIYVLGGNQGDAVNVTRVKREQLRALRWPKSWQIIAKPLPRMTPGDIPENQSLA